MRRLLPLVAVAPFLAGCERIDWSFPLTGWIGGALLGLGVGMGVARYMNFTRRQNRRDDRG